MILLHYHSFLVVGILGVGDDLLLLHQEIEDAVDDASVDPKDLGRLIALDDSLFH